MMNEFFRLRFLGLVFAASLGAPFLAGCGGGDVEDGTVLEEDPAQLEANEQAEMEYQEEADPYD